MLLPWVMNSPSCALIIERVTGDTKTTDHLPVILFGCTIDIWLNNRVIKRVQTI